MSNSVSVLSIEVKLEKGEPIPTDDGTMSSNNKIKVYIKDPITGTEKITELIDDDDPVFTTFTDDLAICLSTLQSVLPHKSKSWFKGQNIKEELLIQTKQSQKEILDRFSLSSEVEVTPTSEPTPTIECVPEFVPGIDETMKQNLLELINTNNKQFKTKDERTTFIKDAVSALLQTESNHLTISLGRLDCANYLGEHMLKGDSPSKVFMTKEGILTDGVVILPFKLDGTTIPPVTNYDSLWKIYDDATIVGSGIKTRYDVNGDNMYDIAVALLQKYKTYEIDNISFIFDTTNSIPFLENNELLQGVDMDIKEQLLKLKKEPKPDINKITAQINSIIDINGNASDKTNDNLKNYCISIISDPSTIYLGNWQIGNSPQDIFLTKDGIITDGFAILPFKLAGTTADPSIPNPGWGYSLLWKLPHTDMLSGEKYRSEYDAAGNKMKTEHKYGGGQTNSRRVVKKRSTRRIRPLPMKTKV
jgi:hypothetical protein